jgi:hypothetical protein
VNKAAVLAVVALVAAGGAGFIAWQQAREVDRVQVELNNTKLGLDKARVDLRKAQQDAAAATKEAAELKISTDQMRADRDSVRTAMENEQAAGVRLRADLALAKEQVSYFSSRAPQLVRGMPRTPKGQ